MIAKLKTSDDEFFTDGSNNTFYYIGDDFVRKVNSSGSFDTVYYYDNSGTLLAKNESGTMYFFHPDHLGSNDLMTDSNGNVVEETFYYPFGLILDGGLKENRLFTGKELDSTDLYYYGARYYDPFMRHFTQADPVISDIYNPQSLNAYSYVLNNPYKYTDDEGDFATLLTAAAGVVAGWYIGAHISIFDQIISEGTSLSTIDWREVGRYSAYGGAIGGFVGATYGLAGIPAVAEVVKVAEPIVLQTASVTAASLAAIKYSEEPSIVPGVLAGAPVIEKVAERVNLPSVSKGVALIGIVAELPEAIKDLTPKPSITSRQKDRLISDINREIRNLNRERDRLYELRSEFRKAYGKKYWKRSDAYDRLREIEKEKDRLADEKSRIRRL